MKLIQLIENNSFPMVSLNELGLDYDRTINEFNSLSGGIVLDDGSTPEWLFRYVSEEEFESIKDKEVMIPSKFYDRIHASLFPEKRYYEPGSRLLAIMYSSDDGWYGKQGNDMVYAVTRQSIPIDRLRLVK